MPFHDWKEFFPGIESANKGEELPVTKAPKGMEGANIFSGKGDTYLLHYGKYIIAMNCSPDKDFSFEIPSGKEYIELPSKQKTILLKYTLRPMTTQVFYSPNYK